jgi:abnormal spindle-like microcephaly-associated protein
LAHPSLYEDHWLDHQEISLSQLLNDIFEPQKGFKEKLNIKEIRNQFLDIYHDATIPLLHKRLQASLLYGALSIPKDLIAKAGRVRDDVGLKRKFLDLWVENYELGPLKAALEVIVGREVPKARPSAKGNLGSHSRSGSASSMEVNTSRLSTGSTTSDSEERRFISERKSIERFIEAFLLKHEDAVRPKGTIGSIAKSADQKGDEFGSPAWSWRRTVLRSLMLILLMDKARTSGAIEGCLFQTLSVQKRSVAMLTALSSMLLPSLGDIVRPLAHLNYSVSAVQYPLEEYKYQISNLATDLRDGVKLTRLVELMLFDNQHMASNTVSTHFQDNP